jgi:hypothetical protein
VERQNAEDVRERSLDGAASGGPATTVAPSRAEALSTAGVLRLQRSAGNRAAVGAVSAATLARQKLKKPDGSPVGPVAPPANGALVRHTQTNVTFSEDKAYVRHKLEAYIEQHDIAALLRFEGADALYVLESQPGLQDPNAAAPAPDSDYVGRVIKVVREQIALLRAHVSQFRDDFQRRANDTLRTILTESEERIKKQLERYGIKDDSTRVAGVNIWESYSGAANQAGVDLGADARALKAKFLMFKGMKGEWEEARSSAGISPRDPSSVLAQRARLEAADKRLKEAQKAYDTERARVEGIHPILQSYNLDPNEASTEKHLEKLGSEKAGDRAEHVGEELTKKLANIQKVRKAADADREYIWKLESITGVTYQLPDIRGHEKLKNEHVQVAVVAEQKAKVQVTEDLIKLGMGVVVLGLGLIAAAPTAGLSAAGAAGVAAAGSAEAVMNIALAYKAYQGYSLEAAEAGTDYDKAKALSAEEPSLFWLALDMVGAVASVPGGAKSLGSLFRNVALAREEALMAKTGKAMLATGGIEGSAEYEKALAKLEKLGDEAKPGAGKKLRAEVEATSPTARTSGAGDLPGEGGRRSALADEVLKVPDPAPLSQRSQDIAAAARVGEGVDRGTATANYFRQINVNPDIEYGVVKHGGTGMYRTLSGKLAEVDVPKEWGGGWEFVRHYHPNLELDAATGEWRAIQRDSKRSIFGARVPSAGGRLHGGPGDLVGARMSSMKMGGRPVSETIDYWDPATNRMKTSQFGYNPGGLDAKGQPLRDKPFWAEFEGADRKRRRFFFKNEGFAKIELNLMIEQGQPSVDAIAEAERDAARFMKEAGGADGPPTTRDGR